MCERSIHFSTASQDENWPDQGWRWNCWSALRRFVLRWRLMHEADRLLRPFLEARDESAADTRLGQLLVEVADPIICRTIGAKFRLHLPLRPAAPRDANALDAEDLCSEVQGQLARRLHALRESSLGPGLDQPDGPAPIQDFKGYVAAVAFSAWNDYLRQKRPARARLLNQIRYLLDGNARHTGLAWWEIPATGERLCGFSAWKTHTRASGEAATLLRAPAEFVADAVPFGELRRINPAKLLAIIFDRLGGPVAIEDLLEAVAELWDVHDDASPDGDMADPALALEQAPTSHPSPYDEARWTEYLSWLWRAVGGLSARQKAAFLLNSEVIKEFEFAGIASIRAVAGALGLNADEVAAFWNDLPLSDNAIADRLSTSRQQVINLRKAARIILGRQLTLLLADTPSPRNEH